jgi:hypothetical protein
MPRSNEDERRQVQVLPERIGAVRLGRPNMIEYFSEWSLILRSLGPSSQVITPERTTLGI